MTIEMGNPGVSGYAGYANQGTASQTDQPPHADGGQTSQQAPGAPSDERAGSPSSNGSRGAKSGGGSGETRSDGAAEASDETSSDFDYDQVPGFEDSASDCFNRASQIARSLNHINLSADHLLLALTMDPNARRLLERVGDIVQLREAATQRLGRMNSRFSRTTGEQSLSPTADLADIGKKARETAAEREQLVAISDLINAFPKANGRLTYASGEGSRAVALIESIEKGLVPRVAESMTRIEAALRDAMHRQNQSAQSILQDLNSRQSQAADQRQRDFMEEIRRQVRVAADLQLAAALRDFGERLDRKLAELAPPEPPAPVAASETESEPPQHVEVSVETPAKARNPWGWLSLL